MNEWSRNQKLTLLGIIVAAVVSIAVPLLVEVMKPSNVVFSSTQKVYLRDFPADKNIINIDNIGTLRPWGGSFGNLEPSKEVVLALNTPVSVLNERMAPVSSSSAYYYSQEPDKRNLYTFNLTSQKSHKLELYGRTFLVTLISIKDLSKLDNKFDINYEYQFALREL